MLACEEEGDDCWIFTEEELSRTREAAHGRAVQALREGAAEASERRASAREAVPLGLEEGSRLVLFYARKLPELCSLCGAPPEVRWTAVVFYRRFFTMRSPMEYDPLPVMFACVHVACKVEEVHEITLDRLLEGGTFGGDAAMKAKVASLELHLLEGLRYQLLLEPKPDMALSMLWEDLQMQLDGHRTSATNSDGPRYAEVPPELKDEVLSRAEDRVVDLSVRTDAVLRLPVSAIIAAALATVLDGLVGGCAAVDTGANAGVGAVPPSRLLLSMLDAGIGDQQQRAAARLAVEGALRALRDLEACTPGDGESDVVQDSVKEAKRRAKTCHRAFERLREEATARNEAHRKERKRRWREMSGGPRRKVATPILQGFAADLNRRAEALRAPAGLPGSDRDEEFIIHRPQEDMFDAEHR